LQLGATWKVTDLLARCARLARELGGNVANSNAEGSRGAVHGGEDFSIAPILSHDTDLKPVHELLAASPDSALRLAEMLARGVQDTTPEDEKYRIAEALTYAVYPKYKFSEFARLFLEDETFLTYYRRFMDPGNWHSLDRKYTLDQLLKLTLHIDGDAAECGVYKGASSYLICRAIKPYGKWNHLFDSFEGLSSPTDRDGTYWTAGGLRADESHIRKNLAEFKNFTVYRGWIPDRFREVADRHFSFVHIDVDLYEPTRESIAFFYDRLRPGGVMLLDDYGFSTCPGAKLAADEFFTDRQEKIIMLPSGQAFIVRRSDT